MLIAAFLGKQFIGFDAIGWSSGFNHPLLGLDHLLTMLAVGIWAAQLRGQAIWMLPLAFVGVMSLGGLAGAAGIALPSVEGIILLSCAVFSVLITRKVRFSAKVNVLIVSFFAFFHGYAHGQEISTSASLISYILGFMLATLLLHGAGILVAKLVVFCVTCLLTAMFANEALAKSTDSIHDDHLNAASKLVQHSGMPQTTPFWLTMRIAGGADSDQLSRPRALNADTERCRDKLSRVPVDWSSGKSSLFSSTEYCCDKPQDHQLLAKTKPAQGLAIFQDRAIFDGDHLVKAGLDFKHYYRDVNHTPGKHLLSNGVGLTSPPVSTALAPQVVQNLRTTPISFIEESDLQLIFAQSAIGNLHTQPIKYLRQDCAVRHQSLTWQSADSGLVCHTNFSSHLTTCAKPFSAASANTSRLHLLPASHFCAPLAMFAKSLDRAIPVPNITIKNNKVFDL
ncbi:HupE/UreJ family protein [Methylomonas albis]|uniref:HupE/UreJ family protein n=1 Tax=Methylomonas albis TaxID=1854563 RepID=UPI001CE20181|nr:HupE/UreJ family protein [Methylomonas albis]